MKSNDYYPIYEESYKKHQKDLNKYLNSTIKNFKYEEYSFELFYSSIRDEIQPRINKLVEISQSEYNNIIKQFIQGIDLFEKNKVKNCLNKHLLSSFNSLPEVLATKTIQLLGEYKALATIKDYIDRKKKIVKEIFDEYPDLKFNQEVFTNRKATKSSPLSKRRKLSNDLILDSETLNLVNSFNQIEILLLLSICRDNTLNYAEFSKIISLPNFELNLNVFNTKSLAGTTTYTIINKKFDYWGDKRKKKEFVQNLIIKTKKLKLKESTRILQKSLLSL